MATTNIRPIKRRLDHVLVYAGNENKTYNENYGDYKYQDLHNVIEYAEADYKTEKRLFVTGLNCTSENAYEQMQITKKIYEKENGILAFHLIQSFAEGEVTPELAHKIGIELSKELFADRFEVVVATHLNTNHYHNHIIINSVSFKDGKKYYDNHQTYSLIRKTSDNLCKEYGLNVLEEKKCKGSNINYNNFYKQYSSENNYKNTAKKDLDLAIAQAFSYDEFKLLMKKMDYEVIIRSGKISIRGNNYKRNIRIERAYGEEYTIDNIKRRILEENPTRIPFIESFKIKKPKLQNNKKFIKAKKNSSGIIALYHHYCFLLKVYPNTKNISKRLPASIRAEVRIMDKYSEEAIFLNDNNLNTEKELQSYNDKISTTLNDLLSQRESLWRYRNNEINEDSKVSITNQISDINIKISKIRKEMKLIEDIEQRIPKMKDNLQEMKKEEKIRKEKNKNERFK